MNVPELSSLLASITIRSLSDNNIKTLRDFCRYTHTEIEELPGVSKKALLIIDIEMKRYNIGYKDEDNNPEVTEYINGYEETVKQKLHEIRKIIRIAIPKVREKMAYGMPTYYYIENLIHFAGFKNHIGIYPTPRGIEVFKEKIGGYKTSKGAIQIPMNEKVPIKLIKEIAEYRYEEMMPNKSGTIS